MTILKHFIQCDNCGEEVEQEGDFVPLGWTYIRENAKVVPVGQFSNQMIGPKTEHRCPTCSQRGL